MPLPSLLEKKLRRLSARPSGGEAFPPSERETIVISIASERLGQAFDEAKKQLSSTSGDVRVIAHGATLERAWPEWIRSEKRLAVTEPGALTHEPIENATRAIQDELHAWLERTFAGRATDALYASARARFLETPIVTYPIAQALAEAFAGAAFVSLDAANHTDTGGWDPDLFRSVLERAGCRVELPFARPAHAKAWPARVALKGAIALGGATVKLRAKPSALLGGVSSVRALARLARGRRIPVGDGLAIDLAPHLWPLLSLATLDVLRGPLPRPATSERTPNASKAPLRAREGAKNVLFLNRHGHPDLVGDGVFRDRLFQEELLDVGRRLAALHPDLSFRWRPDPATVDEAIAHGRAFFPEAELSRGRALAEDTKWADVIVASWSSDLSEALTANVPLVLQARSEMIGLPILATFSDEQLFFTTDEGVRNVAAAIARKNAS